MSKALQIFDQRVFFRGRQVDAEFVALIAAGAFTDIIFGADPLRLRTLANEPDILRIVNIITAIEYLWPLGDRL